MVHRSRRRPPQRPRARVAPARRRQDPRTRALPPAAA